jgi:hypothetical protein
LLTCATQVGSFLRGPPDLLLWQESDVEDYRQWVQDHAPEYANRADFTRDCADWPVFVLISFAKERWLPVTLVQREYDVGVPAALDWARLGIIPKRIHLATNRHLSIEPPVLSRSYDSLADRVRKPIGPQDLDDLRTEHTLNVPTIEELKPGDLITSNGHAQMVLANDSAIVAPDKDGTKPRRVLEILQGNLERTPQLQPAATSIQHRAWDLESKNYYYCIDHQTGGTCAWEWRSGEHNSEQEFKEQFSHGKWHLRRWNFEFFNRSRPVDIPSNIP